MSKIMVLVHSREMVDYAESIIKSDNIENCDVEQIQTADSVNAARRAIEKGASVIVARGLQAAIIKEYTKVSLVEISLTGQEIGLLIVKAKTASRRKRPKIAFIGYETMFPDTSYMNRLFDVELRIYKYQNHGMIENLVADAVNDGADVIVGGERVLDYAARYPIITLFLEATEDSIRRALRVAKTVLYTSQMEKENTAQLLTVLDAVYNGVIRVDNNKKIVTVNHAAELFLDERSDRILGQQLENVLPNLEPEYVDKILGKKQEVLNTSIEVKKENYMLTIAPIEVDGEITGAILSMNRFHKLGADNKETISDNYLSGYLAHGEFTKITTGSQQMKHCIELARTYALSASPVIIYGETGTEQELFAQGIHNGGVRKISHYITVNCRGLTQEQQLSTIFGDEMHKGAFEQASYGTLVIRDIDALSLLCQYRLMKVLRSGRFMKTDFEETPVFEARVIATAQEELGRKVKEGKFREDLYYILNVFSIRIPPLRERRDDIPNIVLNHVQRFNKQYSKRVMFTNGGMEAMKNATWEGNELQLERFCERLVLTATKRNADEVIIQNLYEELFPCVETKEEAAQRIYRYESPEATKIRDTLFEHNGNRQKTAEALGISTATLWRKIKKHRIEF